MHVPLDYASCALKGVDPYVPESCSVANFNIPPVWLWLGWLGLDGSASDWLGIAIIGCAAVVTVMLFQGRPKFDGLVGLAAILSPPVMMGVERGNPDLLILALVGTAALVYRDNDRAPYFHAILLLSVGIILKLFPMFCVTLAARLNRKTFLFAITIAVLGISYRNYSTGCCSSA